MTAQDQFDNHEPASHRSAPAEKPGGGDVIPVGLAELTPRTRVALWVLRIAALILTGMVIVIFIAQLQAR